MCATAPSIPTATGSATPSSLDVLLGPSAAGSVAATLTLSDLTHHACAAAPLCPSVTGSAVAPLGPFNDWWLSLLLWHLLLDGGGGISGRALPFKHPPSHLEPGSNAGQGEAALGCSHTRPCPIWALAVGQYWFSYSAKFGFPVLFQLVFVF